METKEQLVNNIKEWIKLDTEISELKALAKEKTNKKKGLTENLVTVMKTNKIDCFDINGGALVYNPTVAEELTKHIMDSREEQVKESIKRKIDK